MQHEIGLLQLVVKEKIGLRKFHPERVFVRPGKVGSQHIEAGEEPATPRTLLVMDALLGRLYAEVGVYRALVGIVLGQVVDGVGGYGIG